MQEAKSSDADANRRLVGRSTGLEAFRARVRATLERAADSGAVEVWCCDTDFAAWPLGESAVVALLQNWSHVGRTLFLLGASFEPLARSQPRFVAWRRHYDHLVQVRICAHQHRADLPSLLWTSQACVQRLEPLHHTCITSTEPGRLVPLRQQLRELWDAGHPAFAATTLGL